MKLSVIITSWNTKKLLNACLASIRSYPPKCSFEIVVVENASADGSADMVEKDFPEFRLIRSAVNTGYAGGNNLGFKHAAGDYLLLLGSDTEVFPGTIQMMVEAMDAKPQAGIISCRLELPGGGLQHSCKRFPSVWNAVAMYSSLHFLNRQYLMSSFDHASEQEIDQPDATCILIRRAALQDVIFDERYAILYNDVDLCQRVKRQGWKIIFIPGARVIHHGSQSTKQAPPNVRLVMYQNILLYYQTYFGFPARMLLAPILVLRYCIAARSLRGVSLFYSLSKASLT